MLKYACSLFIALSASAFSSLAATLDARQVDRFIDQMVETHGYDGASLRQMFAQANRIDSVLLAIAKPAERKTWHQYRPIFLTAERIKAGLAFWDANQVTLEQAWSVYGVPPEMIVAVIGVESFYGRNTGSYRVVDALGTLAFHYPKRAEFFHSELVQYLLLAREENIDPLSLTGSYAGAMGLPQFISSSFRRYAVDFDGDRHRDIWNDNADAIGSVANYFYEHGWQRGGPIVTRVRAPHTGAAELVSESLMPDRLLGEFMELGLEPTETVEPDESAVLVELEGEHDNEYWFGFKNFSVITRYNHSAKYAMAVTQLAGSIRDARMRQGSTE